MEDSLRHFESFGVVDLVEDGQGQDLADAGHRVQQVEGLRIVVFCLAYEVEFTVSQQPSALASRLV